MHTLSEQLAVLRRRRGFSQADLAKLCGISERQVSRYENGGADVMSTGTFSALLYYLAETPDEKDALIGALAELRNIPW
jgi:transcriptional regulator with XRE-family HTH domain|tara:strand:+ start:1105 stop:1341 length:237 start_codon:yes stop_codon:yes gene_type:complete